jgi:hypothetical protein
MLRISNLHHQRNDNPMMPDSSALAAEASNDGTMLVRDVVKRDHACLEDIRLEAAAKIGEGAQQGRGSLGGNEQLGCLMELICFIANSRMHEHTRNTTNGSCGDFAFNSCPMGPRY